MTEWIAWFSYQLQASADGFLWAFSQIPTRLREQVPPVHHWAEQADQESARTRAFAAEAAQSPIS